MFSHVDIFTIEQSTFTDIIDSWASQYKTRAEEADNVRVLLKSLMNEERGDLLVDFLQTMKDLNADETEQPYQSWLYTLTIDKSIVKFLTDTLDPEYFDLASGLVHLWDEEEVRIGTVNLSNIFRTEDLEQTAIEALRSFAEEADNTRMIAYTTNILTELAKYGDKPTWVLEPEDLSDDDIAQTLQSNYSLVESLPVVAPVKWVSVSVEEDAKYIVSLAEEDYDLDHLYEETVRKMRAMSAPDREELISQLVSNRRQLELANDPDVFRVFGPCLPIPGTYDLHLRSKDPCLMHGGCRMFTCYENENIDSLTEEPLIEDIIDRGLVGEIQWFTGRCELDSCQALIRKRHYAVRMPLETGGWVGCYCSWQCVKGNLDDNNNVRLLLVEGVERQHTFVGVYDRL